MTDFESAPRGKQIRNPCHRLLPPPIVKHLRRFFQKVLFAGILFTAKLTPLLSMLTPRNDTRNEG